MQCQILSLKNNDLHEEMESELEQYSKESKGNINSNGVKLIKTLNKQLLAQKKKKKWALSSCNCYPFRNLALNVLCFYQINTDAQLGVRGLQCRFLKIKKSCPNFRRKNDLIVFIYGLNFSFKIIF